MAYNFCVKEFANGTVQLTYYDYPILDKFDKESAKFKKGFYEDCDLGFLDDDEFTPWGDSLEDVSCLHLGALRAQEEETVELTEEEIQKRKDRSLKSSLNRSIHKIYDIGRNNIWEWFFTFTLNENAVTDRTDYIECSSKVRKWFNNIRRICPDIKYLIVPERHPSSGAWHFHALVSDADGLEFKVAKNNQEFLKDENGNIINNKKGQPKRNKYYGQDLRTSYPNGNYIYNIVNYNEDRYGFSTATKITDTRKAVSYIVKYLTKELGECTFGKNRYFISSNLTLPHCHFYLQEKKSLGELIHMIEESYGIKVCQDYIKSVVVNQSNYKNTINYVEFE